MLWATYPKTSHALNWRDLYDCDAGIYCVGEASGHGGSGAGTKVTKGGNMGAPWVLICMVFAFVLFAIAAFAWPAPIEPWRVKIVAAGLMFYVLAQLIGK